MSKTPSTFRARIKAQVLVPAIFIGLLIVSVSEGTVWVGVYALAGLLLFVPLCWKAVVFRVDVDGSGLTVRTVQRQATGSSSPMRFEFDDLEARRTSRQILWISQELWFLTRPSDGAGIWFAGNVLTPRQAAQLRSLLARYRTDLASDVR